MALLAEGFTDHLLIFMQNKKISHTPFELHLFWLPIFMEQANNIHDKIASYYTELKDEAYSFSRQLADFFIRSIEMNRAFKIGETDFPMANRISVDIESNMEKFAEFIVELYYLVNKKEIPGLLDVLTLDHLYRMLCFYLTELSFITDVTRPACDPAGPRRAEPEPEGAERARWAITGSPKSLLFGVMKRENEVTAATIKGKIERMLNKNAPSFCLNK